MTDLIDTTEMYLKTIYELDEEGIVPLRARIAERLGHSGPTVSQTVARMERDGLVVVSGDRHLEFTRLGHDKAMRVMRKHRLAERLLTDVIRLDWEQVHNEACRWEHVMSEAVEKRLLSLLSHHETDPYGNPIPGLGEFGDEYSGRPAGGGAPLAEVADELATGAELHVVVCRIAEFLQVDEDLLACFSEAQVLPGREIQVWVEADGLVVSGAGRAAAVALSEEVARHVFVVVA